MNRQKNIGPLLLLVIMLFSFGAIPVYASEVNSLAPPVPSASPSSAVPAQGGVQTQVPSVAPPASVAPPVSSKAPVSSRKPRSSKASSIVSSMASSEISSAPSSEASSEIVLPSVGSIAENNPISSVAVDSSANSKLNWLGIISWAFIALGVLVVILVVFSNRRPPSGGPGRKRYHKKPGRSKKKHLLNDKYYRNIKY